MLELLLVVAIVSTLLTITFINGRRTLRGQQETAAINTVRQSIWQGATAASARGRNINLELDGNELRLERPDGDEVRVERRFTLPDSVSLNVGDGTIMSFNPPGKVTDASLTALAATPLVLRTPKNSYVFEITVIGEVRAEVAEVVK